MPQYLGARRGERKSRGIATRLGECAARLGGRRRQAWGSRAPNTTDVTRRGSRWLHATGARSSGREGGNQEGCFKELQKSK